MFLSVTSREETLRFYKEVLILDEEVGTIRSLHFGLDKGNPLGLVSILATPA